MKVNSIWLQIFSIAECGRAIYQNADSILTGLLSWPIQFRRNAAASQHGQTTQTQFSGLCLRCTYIGTLNGSQKQSTLFNHVSKIPGLKEDFNLVITYLVTL